MSISSDAGREDALGEDKGVCVIKVHRPNTQEKLFFLLSGIIVGVPIALFFEQFASNLCLAIPIFSGFCSIVIFGPVIEEFAKAFPLFYRHGETQRSMVTLGFFIGLGFGLAEFFIYVFLVGVPFYVRIPQVFFHASSTTIVAYGIAKKRIWQFYLVAVALHLLINFFTFFSDIILVAGVGATLVVTYFLAWRAYEATSEDFIK